MRVFSMLALSLAPFALAVGLGIAQADPPTETKTVDGIDRQVCHMEDGSDSKSLPCVWTDPDTGVDYLTFADRSYPIHP